MGELLIQTQKQIWRKLNEAGGDHRPLLVSELPFESIAWGLQLSVVPVAGQPPAPITLTWQLLNQTVEGLFRCVYNKRDFAILQVIITRKVGDVLENMGQLTLGYAADYGGSTS